MNIQPESKEWEFLLFACHLAIKNKSKTDLNAPSVEVINWDQLWLLASRHQVRPLLYRGIVKWDEKDLVPSDFFEKLKAFNFRLAARNLGQVKELIRILELFHLNDIGAIPLKGAVLSEMAFEGIAYREFSDIDLMIRLEEIEKVKNILLKENYELEHDIPEVYWNRFKKQNCEYNFDFYKNGKRIFHIEPHWFIGRKMSQLDICFNQLKGFTQYRPIFNKKIKVYSPEGMILTTCLHHVGKEEGFSLKHVCDIKGLMSQYGKNLNWDVLLKVAHDLSVENLLLLGVGVTHKIYPLQLPVDVESTLQTEQFQKFISFQYALLTKERTNDLTTKRFFERMKFLFLLRKKWFTKIKILYYHVLQIILPNEGDLMNKPITRIDYYLLFFKKPFRLWHFYSSKKIDNRK